MSKSYNMLNEEIAELQKHIDRCEEELAEEYDPDYAKYIDSLYEELDDLMDQRNDIVGC